MTSMPILDTGRLSIRPLALADLDAVHRLLDLELADADTGSSGPQARDARRRWLEWTVLGYEQQALLYQPPYGERAVILKATGALIGLTGFAPGLAPFARLPYFRARLPGPAELFTPEVGLYYAFSPACRRQGYASEAAAALVRYAFERLQLARIIATTTYDNLASIGVMRRLGMQIEKNPTSEPAWLQVVGILENPISTTAN